MAHLYRYRLASTQIILHHDSSSVVVPRDHYRNMCNVWYCTTSLNLNSVGNAGDDVDGWNFLILINEFILSHITRHTFNHNCTTTATAIVAVFLRFSKLYKFFLLFSYFLLSFYFWILLLLQLLFTLFFALNFFSYDKGYQSLSPRGTQVALRLHSPAPWLEIPGFSSFMSQSKFELRRRV